MAIKLNKTPKKSLKAQTLDELGDSYKEAIFNHPDCKKVFDEKIKAIKLPVTEESQSVIAAFANLLPKISDNTLNLSDVENEYEQLVTLITLGQEGEYSQHPGIFILMVNNIRKNPAETYCSSILARLQVFKSCTAVLNTIRDIQTPIRNECVSTFWDNATQDQKDEIRLTVKHHANPQAMGMPGNMGIQQFGR